MSAQEDSTFNFDNEIVIGVTRIPDANKKTNTHNKKSNKNSQKIKKESIKQKETNIPKKENTAQRKNNKNNSQNIKKNKKNRFIKRIIKWTFLLSALAASFVFFMMSPLFNVSQIQVINNEKINSDTIISLSEIKIGENIYKTSSKQIEKNIKQNAYIESAKIKRKLPNKILVEVEERKASFMLEYANSYAYINNQGYILEISNEKLELPIIAGYTTSQDEIKTGNRINTEDLEKMAVVLKIVESANSIEIGNLITKINIHDKQNYTVIFEGENKTAYLGDASNLSNRMLYIKAVIEDEKGVAGEIFVNGDLNKTDVYFRY